MQIATFHLRNKRRFTSHTIYDMPGLAPLTDIVFFEQRSFPISHYDKDMLRNACEIVIKGSSMVDTASLSSIIKFPSPESL